MLEEYMEYTSNQQKENLKDHDMEAVGLGNTWILIDYVQNPPWTLLVITPCKLTNQVHSITQHLVLVRWVLKMQQSEAWKVE